MADEFTQSFLDRHGGVAPEPEELPGAPYNAFGSQTGRQPWSPLGLALTGPRLMIKGGAALNRAVRDDVTQSVTSGDALAGVRDGIHRTVLGIADFAGIERVGDVGKATKAEDLKPIGEAREELDVAQQGGTVTRSILYGGTPYILGGIGAATGVGIAGGGLLALLGAGVTADALIGTIVENPDQANLGNLVVMLAEANPESAVWPKLAPVFRYLATDPQNSELQNRLKNGAVEALTNVFGEAVFGVAHMTKLKRAFDDGSLETLGRSASKNASGETEAAQRLLEHNPELAREIYGKEFTNISADLAMARGSKRYGALVGKLVADVEKMRSTTIGRFTPALSTEKPAKVVDRLLTQFTDLAREGAVGRDWYADSAQAVLRVAGGDVELADTFLQLVAIYSPRTGVQANLTKTVKAWNQWMAGKPIEGVGFGRQDAAANRLLYEGIPFEGRKVNNFYNNLMWEIDPARAQGVTADMWMARAAMFPEIRIPQSSRKFDFIEGMTVMVADEFGWTPHQAQAAVWVATKARFEGARQEAFEAAVDQGFMRRTTAKRFEYVDDSQATNDAVFQIWAEKALTKELTPDEIAKASRSFGDFMGDQMARVSLEAQPAADLGHFPELAGAAPQVQAEYFSNMMAAFRNGDGRDLVAEKLGILSPGGVEAPGFYAGESAPSMQVDVAATRVPGTVAPTAEAETLMEAYGAIYGLLLKQESAGWHRPQFTGVTKKASNGVQVETVAAVTPDQIKTFAEAIEKGLPEGIDADDLAIVAGQNHIRVIFWNQDKLETMDNIAFQRVVGRAAVGTPGVGEAKLFGSSSNLVFGDWENGAQGYTNAIREAGGDDLVRWVREDLLPRVRSAEASYAEAQGWTANPEVDEVIDGALGVVTGGRTAFAVSRPAESPFPVTGAQAPTVRPQVPGDQPQKVLPFMRGKPAITDREGRPLVASVVAGIRDEDGPNRGITPAEAAQIAYSLADVVHVDFQLEMAGIAGAAATQGSVVARTAGGETVRVPEFSWLKIAPSLTGGKYLATEQDFSDAMLLNPDLWTTFVHEVGHTIHHAAGFIEDAIKADMGRDWLTAQREMMFLSMHNRPWMWPDLLGDVKGVNEMSPERLLALKTYREEAPELVADSIAQYLQDPAFAKSQAPTFTKWLRRKVNDSEFINRVVQFNEAAAGLAATGAAIGAATTGGSDGGA